MSGKQLEVQNIHSRTVNKDGTGGFCTLEAKVSFLFFRSAVSDGRPSNRKGMGARAGRDFFRVTASQ